MPHKRVHRLQVEFEERRPRVEFLTEGHRHGVLQLRAPDRHVVRVLVRQLVERRAQAPGRFGERGQAAADRELARRGVGVVRRLRMVDVVVGVDVVVVAARAPADLERAVRDDLVHVHVEARAGTALQHIDGELVGERAVLDLLARLLERLGLARVDQPEFGVRDRAGALDDGVGADERLMRAVRNAAHREILDRALRMDAPIYVLGHFERPYAIMLDAHTRGRRCW